MSAPDPAASVIPPRHAVILAAGMGTRLRPFADGLPKGLVEIEGETLVGRSLRLLRASGVDEITLVAGYAADRYRRFAAAQPDVRIVVNESFATTGSMASLAVAVRGLRRDVFVLESDIVYEARGLSVLVGSSAADATLLSGSTGAGDEVWVFAPDGRLESMSKRAGDLEGVTGEFVGITRLSAEVAEAMVRAFDRFVELEGHGRMDYESDALVRVGRDRPIRAELVPDLRWGEVDNLEHLERVKREVWPAVSGQRP